MTDAKKPEPILHDARGTRIRVGSEVYFALAGSIEIYHGRVHKIHPKTVEVISIDTRKAAAKYVVAYAKPTGRPDGSTYTYGYGPLRRRPTELMVIEDSEANDSRISDAEERGWNRGYDAGFEAGRSSGD